ncbi:hypothetical protein [Xanthomonas citri]|uniref:hypothetical protein n=1 Tax=Xanthomonas citri TaxID=346 RepID=UPI0005B3B686|nr:hypothetical protein [Xanthomonas citri]AMU97199.1 hypothetical protein TP37_03040 [Xanthomonas citri pv. aurantifolii]AMV01549.1 hypothetical protein TP50_03065 [Xanthomonas citri pv. aurantifolii]MCC8490432.1 hypothetical protein [Xanthomonas citri pv. fuscans]TBW98266.1 hypothetical protein TP47_09225 [Xanthomonas citri pv. aurantifolii]TBW99515.1 hypothetical protein TP49_04090 [Xanthomonas citri pv. aurantifolii]
MAIHSSSRRVLLCVLLTMTGAVAAQSATTTRSSTTLQPITTPTPVQPTVPPRAQQPAPSAAPVPSQLGQRPVAPSIPTHGPAQMPIAPAGNQVAPTKPMVYDRNGRLLQGMQPAGANRVLDTKTGRYYDAVPAGDGMRVVR